MFSKKDQAYHFSLETIINLNRPLSKKSKDHAETKISTRINPAIAVKKANKCILCH